MIAWLCGILLLVVCAFAYRTSAQKLQLLTSEPIRLPVALKNFPLDMAGWQGREVAISETVLKVANNDDFLSRVYINNTTRQWANIYVAYSAQPRTMLGHRPQVCYPAGGYFLKSSREITLTLNNGTGLDANLHCFAMPGTAKDTYVLNFYIVNGELTTSESVFSGISFRTPNLQGDIARYVAQIQISSAFQSNVIDAAKVFAPRILRYFPDPEGNVPIARGPYGSSEP